MKYGVYLPNFGIFQDARTLAEWAKMAEDAGWDGFFIWDHVLYDPSWHPMVDPWIGLAAAALATEKIMLGTLITPIPRRRPWKLARETVSLERLSNGRFILGVGLGDPVKWEYDFFHEEGDAKIRAARLDEGLTILQGLWTGEPFQFTGTHYQLEEMIFRPMPTRPIPIWVGGWLPRKKPMQRAARYQGFVPGGDVSPADWREALSTIQKLRSTDQPFDAVQTGRLPDNGSDSQKRVAEYAAAGVTWWLEDISPGRYGGWDWRIWAQPWNSELLRDRVLMGPPKID